MADVTGVAASRSGHQRPMRIALRRAAPALLAFAAVRALGLAVLGAFAVSSGRPAHHLLVSWDGQWYEGIARDGYGFVRVHEDGRILSDYAFFPLYPMLERLVAEATGIGYVDAGLVISWSASVFAAWGIFAIADHLNGPRVGVLATVLWAAVPVGIVTSMAYSESLFTALAAWSLYATLTGRWVYAGALASLAGLTRPTGLAVIAAVIVPAALTELRRRRGSMPAPTSGPWSRQPLVGALIAPLGWLAYVGWVGVQLGTPTGYFDVTARWGNSFDGGFAFAQWVAGLLASQDFVLGLLVCLGVAVLVWPVALCIRQGQPMPLLIFAGCLVVLALTTSGYFGSKPRYLLPAFPLLFPLAAWLARQRIILVAAVVTLVVATSVVYGGVWLLGSGPP